MTQPGPITEKTKIAITITSWYHVAVILIFLTGLYFAVRGDVNEAILQGSKNSRDIEQAQDSIFHMRMDIQAMTDDLKYFRAQYERDMQQYIREPQPPAKH